MVPTTPNVLRVFKAATRQQRREGIGWYRHAHGVAASLDSDVVRAAGVIAALSPRMSWARNVELAGRAYAEGKASGALGRSCAAADAILAGAHPVDVLHGPKVRAFFTLILDPADDHTVCVDRHAIDVAVGHKLVDTDRSVLFPLDRRGLYERFARCYRRAGKQLGVLPAQVQAVTWVTWRANLTT